MYEEGSKWISLFINVFMLLRNIPVWPGNSRKHNFGSQNFALTPFYRFYFFDLKDYGARGFFVETFTSFASVRSYDGVSLPFPEGDFEEPKQKDVFQWSLGFAAGRKWVNKRGFSFEFFLGLGRYLLNTDYTDEVHPHIGANFGKRF